MQELNYGRLKFKWSWWHKCYYTINWKVSHYLQSFRKLSRHQTAGMAYIECIFSFFRWVEENACRVVCGECDSISFRTRKKNYSLFYFEYCFFFYFLYAITKCTMFTTKFFEHTNYREKKKWQKSCNKWTNLCLRRQKTWNSLPNMVLYLAVVYTRWKTKKNKSKLLISTQVKLFITTVYNLDSRCTLVNVWLFSSIFLLSLFAHIFVFPGPSRFLPSESGASCNEKNGVCIKKFNFVENVCNEKISSVIYFVFAEQEKNKKKNYERNGKWEWLDGKYD